MPDNTNLTKISKRIADSVLLSLFMIDIEKSNICHTLAPTKSIGVT